MIKKYIKGAHAIILAYDLTQYQSFADLDDWFRLVVEAFEVPGAAAASNAAALATASGESKVGEEATEAAASTLGDGITQHSVGGRIVAARLPHVVLVANKMVRRWRLGRCKLLTSPSHRPPHRRTWHTHELSRLASTRRLYRRTAWQRTTSCRPSPATMSRRPSLASLQRWQA